MKNKYIKYPYRNYQQPHAMQDNKFPERFCPLFKVIFMFALLKGKIRPHLRMRYYLHICIQLHKYHLAVGSGGFKLKTLFI